MSPSRSNSKWSLNPLLVTLLPANLVSMVTIMNVGESADVKKLSLTMSPQRLLKWSQDRKTGNKFNGYFEFNIHFFLTFCKQLKPNCHRVKKNQSAFFVIQSKDMYNLRSLKTSNYFVRVVCLVCLYIITYHVYYDIIQPITKLDLFQLGSYRMPGCPGKLYWISSQW